MLSIWKKKKLHKKVLFAIAVPYTKEQFECICNNGLSDFVKGLERKYHCSGDNLWNYYKTTAKAIEKTIDYLREKGVIIVNCLTLHDLEKMKGMDATIVVAHHSDITKEFELYDGMVKDEEFVEKLPADYAGWLDLSCCNSERLQSLVRMHFGNPDAHIIAPDRKTAVNFRMEMYQRIIKNMCKNVDLDYFEAFKMVIKDYQKTVNATDFFEIEHLGSNDTQSSVYAPREVLRGQSFMIQVHVHKRSDADDIDLKAKAQDEDAEKRPAKDLIVDGKNVRLKKGDEIGILLKNIGEKDDFKFLTPTRKSIRWGNSSVSEEFVVKVSDDCKSESFMGKVKVFVNRIPAAEVSIKAKVVNSYSEVKASELHGNTLIQFDKRSEMRAAKEQLLRQLTAQQEKLTNDLAAATNVKEKRQIESDLEICTNSIRIVNEDESVLDNTKKIVFVSSTSDLKGYREAIEEVIKMCDMVPEMYEYWPQKDKTPSDACCAKVLSSDILVCILGAKYGFVRKDSGSSMTEMELKCALQSGKPILIYVLKDYKALMQSMLPEKKEEVEKQSSLIDKFERDRMIKYITDETSLSTISGIELAKLHETISN